MAVAAVAAEETGRKVPKSASAVMAAHPTHAGIQAAK